MFNYRRVLSLLFFNCAPSVKSRVWNTASPFTQVYQPFRVQNYTEKYPSSSFGLYPRLLHCLGLLLVIFITFIDQQDYQHHVVTLWGMKSLLNFTLIKHVTDLPSASSVTNLCCFSPDWPQPRLIVWLNISEIQKKSPQCYRMSWSDIIALLSVEHYNTYDKFWK